MRFKLLMAVIDGQWHYSAGSTIADVVANQQSGDVLSSYWCLHLTPSHVPLDASAITAMQGAGFVTNGAGQRVNGAPCSITGVESIAI